VPLCFPLIHTQLASRLKFLTGLSVYKLVQEAENLFSFSEENYTEKFSELTNQLKTLNEKSIFF
jgi:hypothetical protein